MNSCRRESLINLKATRDNTICTAARVQPHTDAPSYVSKHLRSFHTFWFPAFSLLRQSWQALTLSVCVPGCWASCSCPSWSLATFPASRGTLGTAPMSASVTGSLPPWQALCICFPFSSTYCDQYDPVVAVDGQILHYVSDRVFNWTHIDECLIKTRSLRVAALRKACWPGTTPQARWGWPSPWTEMSSTSRSLGELLFVHFVTLPYFLDFCQVDIYIGLVELLLMQQELTLPIWALRPKRVW